MTRFDRGLFGYLAAFLALGVILYSACLLGAASSTQDSSFNPFRKDQVDRALERAIDFLLKLQQPDGSIFDSRSARPPRVGRNSTAMTSLAVLAIASVGHQAGDDSPEGRALLKALNCVLDPRRIQELDGSVYFGGRDGSRMYGHGITTLMLAELLGMGVDREQDRRIRERLEPALRLILRAQAVKKQDRYKGGWRYYPTSPDADLSVTVWQVMALRSAKNAGIPVPADAIKEAADYIRRSYGHARRGSSGTTPSPFAYQPGGRAQYSTAAAGLLALQVCGYYDDPTVKGAAEWLFRQQPRWGTSWLFYGTYYYAQGMYQRGGKYAQRASRVVRDLLLPHQQPDGSWQAPSGQERTAGRVYATALAVLSLSVKYHYLPIYQR